MLQKPRNAPAHNPNRHNQILSKRYINEHSNLLFKKAISLVPPLNPCSADDLVENFILNILKVIDVIAPYKVKTISGKQKAPWRKAASVTAQKKECRKVKPAVVLEHF